MEFQTPLRGGKAVEFYEPGYGRCRELKRDEMQGAEESVARLWREVL
jgi:hypothetical protein